jgi:predicted DNA-binding transcriptional regulator AlpA
MTDLPVEITNRRVLRTRDARAYCGIPGTTWKRIRAGGEGPPAIRLSARTLGYRVSDLDAWLDARTAAQPNEHAA